MISSMFLITICSLMMFTSIYRGIELSNKHEDQYFINDYLFKQSESIVLYQNTEGEDNIYFNELGHINQARTLDINNKKIVITLGNGRIHQ